MDFDMNAAKKSLLENDISKARPLEEMFSVKGKTAIVTGGTSGLGFNIAFRLLQGGANVVIASNQAGEGEFSLSILKKAGFSSDRLIYSHTDVSDENDILRLIELADGKFASIDIFVNCASVWSYAHVYDMPVDEFRRVTDINITGAFLCVKHISRYMIEKETKGKITLISSNCAWLPYPVFGGYPHYCASKGAINALVVETAKELKRFDIMVNGVAPGGMVTAGSSGNMCAKGLSEEKQDEFYDELMVWQNDGPQSVDSVAIVAYAMSTAMSDGMTGEVVVADAGMSHNIVKYQVAIDQYPEELPN